MVDRPMVVVRPIRTDTGDTFIRVRKAGRWIDYTFAEIEEITEITQQIFNETLTPEPD